MSFCIFLSLRGSRRGNGSCCASKGCVIFSFLPLLIGFAGIILGAIIYVGQVDEAERVSEYNVAAMDYMSTNTADARKAQVQGWLPSTVTATTLNAAASTASANFNYQMLQVPLGDAQWSDVYRGAMSTALQTTLAAPQTESTSTNAYTTTEADVSFAFPVNSPGGELIPFTLRQVPLTRVIQSTTIYCKGSGGCGAGMMASMCKENHYTAYGGGVYSGAGCNATGSSVSQPCGVCSLVVHLSNLCAVVAPSSASTRNQFGYDAAFGACTYPFTANASLSMQNYKNINQNPGGSNPITITVRRSDDPMLLLEKLTQGKDDFSSVSMTRLIAKVVFAIGGVFLAMWGIFFVCILVQYNRFIKDGGADCALNADWHAEK